MRKIASNIFIVLLTLCFVNFGSIADDSLNKTDSLKETELNFFTGMFDFSDEKQSSGFLGLTSLGIDLYHSSELLNSKSTS